MFGKTEVRVSETICDVFWGNRTDVCEAHYRWCKSTDRINSSTQTQNAREETRCQWVYDLHSGKSHFSLRSDTRRSRHPISGSVWMKRLIVTERNEALTSPSRSVWLCRNRPSLCCLWGRSSSGRACENRRGSQSGTQRRHKPDLLPAQWKQHENLDMNWAASYSMTTARLSDCRLLLEITQTAHKSLLKWVILKVKRIVHPEM